MSNPSEKLGDPAETAPAARAAGVDALFVPQMRQLGCVPVDAAAFGRQGRLWAVDPAVGEGTGWYFPLDGCLAVGAFDLMLREEGGFFCDAAGCFFLGSYNRAMLPYLGLDPVRPDRTVVGHAWKRVSYHQRVPGGVRLRETFVVLMPEGLRRVALRLHCDPATLGSAIAALDGTSCPAGLPSLLDDLGRARPSALVAETYYECKATEACALIADWHLASGGVRAAFSVEDSTAVAAAQRLVQLDLSRFVTTEELCRACCVGASKLIGLFKASCGMTPQEYARDVRMRRACELLETTDLPIADIAARLGYTRQGSFSEAFRAQCGLSARDWREDARNARQQGAPCALRKNFP